MSVPQDRVIANAERVGIGEYRLGGPEDAFRVTLGSCVGVCLLWSKQSRFAVAHVLLPRRSDAGEGARRSRTADTVIPFLLQELGVTNERRQVCAYVAGGGVMYETEGENEPVGSSNQRVLLASLEEHRIRVAKTDLGGSSPRQLVVAGPARLLLSLQMGPEPKTTTWEFPSHFPRNKAA